MKTYIFSIFLILLSASLSAQPAKGKWTNGNTSDALSVHIRPTPKGGVVFEVETTVMKARGTLSDNGTILTFKNSDGILQLKRLQNPNQFQNKSGFLMFKSKKGNQHIVYQYLKGSLKLPGWDKGKAVVINHEEQYSRKPNK